MNPNEPATVGIVLTLAIPDTPIVLIVVATKDPEGFCEHFDNTGAYELQFAQVQEFFASYPKALPAVAGHWAALAGGTVECLYALDRKAVLSLLGRAEVTEHEVEFLSNEQASRWARIIQEVEANHEERGL